MVRRHRAGVALALLSVAFAGCGEHRSLVAPPVGSTEPPPVTVRATRMGPIAAAGSIRYRIDWQVPPGGADHFVYTLDPRASNTVDGRWTSTRATSFELAVPSRSTALAYAREGRPTATTFLIRAVDREGHLSPLGGVSVVADNIAPTVQILQPVPSDRSRTYVPTTFTVTWAGTDPDGFTGKPVKYKYTLLTPSTESLQYLVALSDPDSVRRRFEPTGYASWDSTGGDTTSVTFSNLWPSWDYLFVVVARDEQGAYSQVFSLNSNMLNFRPLQDGLGGPVFTLFNSSFDYTYPAGAYVVDAAHQVPLGVAAGTPVTVNWSATPNPGATLFSYRWALDIDDVFDQTPRIDESTDLAHWSAPNPATTSASVGPFGPSETHVLYVEAMDSNGLKSLAMVRIETTPPFSATHDLLIVDDTRLRLDGKAAGATCVSAPIGNWPTAAELDTFLYARGGYPWQCYPAGTTSTPGLFAGYDFDTLGTLGTGTVPLASLLPYRHVIWLTDQLGALNVNPPASLSSSITSLRFMSGPGMQNTLAAYVAMGGSLWLAGGGIATASMMPWNRSLNDSQIYGPAFSSIPTSGSAPELGPGRFPWEIAGWRSEIRATNTPVAIARSLGRFGSGGTIYDQLPSAMRLRTTASDPLPPLRTASSFYRTTAEIEYLDLPNSILGADGRSDLDSLYAATGAALVPPASNPIDVCMTVDHPDGANAVIFTGFSLWGFQRADSKALVDWVLQQMWGSDATPYSPPIPEQDPQPVARHTR